MKTDVVIFKKNNGNEMTLEDLLRKVYENSVERHDQIIATSEHVTSKINGPADAVMLLPALIELQKVAVKNDDQLLNLAGVIQRAISAEKKGKSEEKFNISADDRKLLLERAKQMGLPSASSDE